MRGKYVEGEEGSRERGVPAELQGGMDGNRVAEHRGSQLLHRCSLQPGPGTPQAQHTDSSHGVFSGFYNFFKKFFLVTLFM